MQSKELKKKSEVLLNCPFCGGEAKLYSGDGYAVVGCKKDDCQGSACCYKYNSKKEAKEQWNTRKPMERIVSMIEDNMEDAEHYGFASALQDLLHAVKEEGGIHEED